VGRVLGFSGGHRLLLAFAGGLVGGDSGRSERQRHSDAQKHAGKSA